MRVPGVRLVATAVALVLGLEQAACTSRGIAPLAYPEGDLSGPAGLILLRDERGGDLPVTPDSTLALHFKDGGGTRPIEARHLCRTATGFSVRRLASDSCDDAEPVATFEEIDSVTVETFDRAATTLIVTGVVVVAVAAILIVAAASKSDDKKAGNGSANATASGGGSTPKARPSAPPPASPPGGGARVRTREGRMGPTIGLGARLFLDLGPGEVWVPLPPGSHEGPGAAPRPKPGPVFRDGAVRRANLEGLVAVDGSVSPFTPDRGATSALRAGVRLYDFADLQLGVRVVEGSDGVTAPRVFPTFGLGLHGELPRARWAALALAFEAGASGAVDLYASGRFGLRVGVLRSFWFGIYPIHPAYAAWSESRGHSWTALSSLDVAAVF